MTRVITLACALLSGCAISSKLSPSHSKDLISTMTYVRDEKTDLCFGVVRTTGNGADIVVIITWVPCEPKVLEQIR